MTKYVCENCGTDIGGWTGMWYADDVRIGKNRHHCRACFRQIPRDQLKRVVIYGADSTTVMWFKQQRKKK